jgi:hypothetical protein
MSLWNAGHSSSAEQTNQVADSMFDDPWINVKTHVKARIWHVVSVKEVMVWIIFITVWFEWRGLDCQLSRPNPFLSPRVISSVEWVTVTPPPTHTHTHARAQYNCRWPLDVHADLCWAVWMNSVTYKAIKGHDFGTLTTKVVDCSIVRSISWFIPAFNCL